MRIRLAFRNISVPVLPSLLSLTVATSGFYFSNVGVSPVLRALTYFDEAELEPMSDMLVHFDWNEANLCYETLPDGERSLVQAADEAAAFDDATDYKKLALVRESGWWRLTLHPLERRV